MSEDVTAEALLEFLNASEAGIAAAKRVISQARAEFKAMLKDLAAHGDKMNREGYFYWLFKNGATVGRKKRK